MKPVLAPDPSDDPLVDVARQFFTTAAAVCGVAAGVIAASDLPGVLRLAVVAGFVAVAALAAVARHWPPARGRRAIVAVCIAALVLIGSLAAGTGWGLNAPGVGFIAILVLAAGGLVGPRAGIAIAMAGAGLLLGMAWAEHAGLLAGPAALGAAPMARRLAVHLMLVGAGLGAGLLIARVVGHYVHANRERHARFVGLLGIAAGAYWETDAEHRFSGMWQITAGQAFEPRPIAPVCPWDAPGIEIAPDALATHRVQVEARLPFRDLHVRSSMPGEGLRDRLVSGEPRFDALGRFRGYWGVSRDVTEEYATRRVLRETETRYRELFALTPLAAVAHREGRVVDANPAALALFGAPSLEAFRGQELFAVFDPADRAAARDRLLRGPPAEGAAPTTHAATLNSGRHVWLRVSCARVDAADPPTLLSIFDDVTELAAAEQALRASRGLLMQLIETSPDVITLTDLATGRYVMVNEAFERLSGRRREEAIGRTSVELGIWGNAQDRAGLLEELARSGTVRNRGVRFVSKSGRPFALLVSAARFDGEGGAYLVLFARDVSASERARLSYEAVLDNASLGIAFIVNARFAQANRAFEQMFGWSGGQLAGEPAGVVWRSPAEYAEVAAQIAPALAAGEPVEFVREMGRRDGSRFWCRLLAKAVDPSHPMHGGTIWIVEDITERRRVEQALARARDDAEAASRAKSAFLANTSHEIRTPLNGLVGLARLARQPEVDAARLRQYLEQIGDSAEALAAVITDVLDLSKIEAGKLQIEALRFDLHEMLASLGRVFGTLADARGLGFSLHIDAALPRHVVGDAVRVRQVLGNYLHNALKFTERGGLVLSAAPAAADGDRVRFEVTDTGPGIAPAVQERLFSAFTQADASTTRRFGGTGLGLSICRELATLMHGRVGVDSMPGAGSRFWAELSLPAAGADAAEAAAGDDAARRLRGARVLLAEDNAVNMTIAVALLEQWGVEVVQALDGAQALAEVARARAAGRPVDAVLMDVQMPVMSGYEAARRLREDPAAASLPIIALTAAALTSERDQALAAGMSAFLTKPIDVQRLRETLVAALDGHDARRR